MQELPMIQRTRVKRSPPTGIITEEETIIVKGSDLKECEETYNKIKDGKGVEDGKE